MSIGQSNSYRVKYVPMGLEKQTTGLKSEMSVSSAGGGFSKEYGRELVKHNLIDLLSTRKGDRVMLPDFGTDLQRYLFEPLDYVVKEDIKAEIARAIAIFEPRVDIVSLEVLEDEESTSFSYLLGVGEVYGNTSDVKLVIELVVSIKDDTDATESIIFAY